MGLALSTAAARGLPPEAIASGIVGRGLEGMELLFGDPLPPPGVGIVALRAETLGDAPALAREAAALGVPVSVPAEAAEDLAALGALFTAAGAQLLLGHGSSLAEYLSLRSRLQAAGDPPSLGLAWELRPSDEKLDEAGAVLLAAGELLRLVRVHGMGPEQRSQDGTGVGPLLAELAISGYRHPIVLTPSRAELQPRWADWLVKRKLEGCGTEAEKNGLHLDMREVEPRDRLDTILGAWASLRRGAILRLTVDHDPVCMRHTLEATEPPGSFDFRPLENGPTVWIAEVQKK